LTGYQCKKKIVVKVLKKLRGVEKVACVLLKRKGARRKSLVPA